MTSPQPRSLKRSRSLADHVVEWLSARVQSGEYAPGDKLPTEAAIMEATGVSRTVVRESLSRLQAAQLVETRHGIGTFVLDPPAKGVLQVSPINLPTLLDVLAIMEVRLSLETEAAGLAALRRDDANLAAMQKALDDFQADISRPGRNAAGPDISFHEEIAKATGNHYFIDMLHQLGKAIIPRARISAVNSAADKTDAYLARVNREHRRILAAIRRQDAEAARAAMRSHLSRSRERLQRILKASRPDH